MYPRSLSYLSLLLVLLFFVGSIPANRACAEERPLLASIVQIDGILLPFAEYKGSTWKSTWLMDEETGTLKSMPLSEISHSWAGYSGPALSEWYLSSADEHNRLLHAFRTVLFPMHCGKDWGLETDFQKQPVEENTFPVPKAGIALTTPQDFVGMEVVGDSGSLDKISALIQPIFDPLDEKAHKDYTDVVQVSSMTVTKLMRNKIPINESFWFYFEARRTYQRRPQINGLTCDRVSFLNGWIEQMPSGRLHLVKRNFTPTDCDFQNVQIEDPLGILHLNQRIYIFSQSDMYEGEAYRISEVDSGVLRVLLEGSGGGC